MEYLGTSSGATSRSMKVRAVSVQQARTTSRRRVRSTPRVTVGFLEGFRVLAEQSALFRHDMSSLSRQQRARKCVACGSVKRSVPRNRPHRQGRAPMEVSQTRDIRCDLGDRRHGSPTEQAGCHSGAHVSGARPRTCKRELHNGEFGNRSA